ncbi:hypothetical protein EV1_009207 [Malus domestica]
MLAQFRPPKPCGPGLDAEPTNCLLESDRRSALQRQDEPDKGRIPSRKKYGGQIHVIQFNNMAYKLQRAHRSVGFILWDK